MLLSTLGDLSSPVLHAGGRPMPRGWQSRVLQLIPCSQHMSEDVELPNKTAQILRHQKECHEKDGAGSWISTRTSFSQQILESGFTKELYHIRSTKQLSKKKASHSSASIKTKVNRQFISRLLTPWTQTQTKSSWRTNLVSLTTTRLRVVDVEGAQKTSSFSKRTPGASSVSTRSKRITSRKSSTTEAEQIQTQRLAVRSHTFRQQGRKWETL